ncbi:hypothetical protein A3Q56_07383 [Intoshia linei]|uniref:Coiled-coil domain-containing protein 132 n=1 Tax=Intoshia linei TaxID=1819745 RepID=A0A177ASC6_9BILA|nr:hypothetical protein A3Q56_07383 [Intoshia linei]
MKSHLNDMMEGNSELSRLLKIVKNSKNLKSNNKTNIPINELQNPEDDKTVISNIASNYFETEFDLSKEIDKFLNLKSVVEMNDRRQELNNELSALLRNSYIIVLRNHKMYKEKLESIMKIIDDIDEIFIINQCAIINNKHGINEFTIKALTLLGSVSKMRQYRILHKRLSMLKTLRFSEQRISYLLEDEDYANALMLLDKFKSAVRNHSKFNCVQQFESTIASKLEGIKTSIDFGIVQCCENFNSAIYSNLQKSFKILNKADDLIETVIHFIMRFIEDRSKQILIGYVQLVTSKKCYEKNAESLIFLKTQNFEYICTLITKDIFSSCFIHLCKAMKSILMNYQLLLVWHHEEYENSETIKKVMDGRIELWQSMQSKIENYLRLCNFQYVSFDNFQGMISAVDDYITLGTEYGLKINNDLNNAVKAQSLKFIDLHHQNEILSLLALMSDESWKACPVNNDFNMYQLTEFGFLKNKNDETNNIPEINQKESLDTKLYKLINMKVTPRTGVAIIANSTLLLFRLFGKYLNLMKYFNDISFSIIKCIFQLFEVYFYFIYCKFVSNNVHHFVILPDNFRNSIKRINEETQSSGFKINEYLKDALNANDVTSNSSNLYGLGERIVACESIIFASDQLLSLNGFIQNFFVESKCEEMYEYLQMIDNVEFTRIPMYAFVAMSAFPSNNTLNEIRSINWNNILELPSAANNYTNDIIYMTDAFLTRIDSLSLSVVCVTEQVKRILSRYHYLCISSCLINGYTSIKKCTQEGRALMLLDIQVLLQKFSEKSYNFETTYLENVMKSIKAYYIPEKEMKTWIQDNKNNFSQNQLICIVSYSPLIDKKARTMLLLEIDNLYQSSKPSQAISIRTILETINQDGDSIKSNTSIHSK